MFKKTDISLVIKDRLNLQSTQEKLSKNFGVNDINLALNKNFLRIVRDTWDEKKRKSYFITLGGPININKTEKLVDLIIES